MADASAFQRQGIFRFFALPMELRRRIYHFAAVKPRPLSLIPHPTDAHSIAYATNKDLRILHVCREFRTEMQIMLYEDNCFSYSIQTVRAERGTRKYQIDLQRIQKVYISVGDMSGPNNKYDEYKFHQNFVDTLVVKGHQLKHLLIECATQDPRSLSFFLAPLSMLRKIRCVHFRSADAGMHHYFRFLEALMMGEWPVRHRNNKALWTSANMYGTDLLTRPDDSWLVYRTEALPAVEVKSEGEMEAVAREMYRFLGMGREFVPQGKLDEVCFPSGESG